MVQHDSTAVSIGVPQEAIGITPTRAGTAIDQSNEQYLFPVSGSLH